MATKRYESEISTSIEERSAVIVTMYLGSGDASKHRRDYRPEWLDNLADDVTIQGPY